MKSLSCQFSISNSLISYIITNFSELQQEERGKVGWSLVVNVRCCLCFAQNVHFNNFDIFLSGEIAVDAHNCTKRTIFLFLITFAFAHNWEQQNSGKQHQPRQDSDDHQSVPIYPPTYQHPPARTNWINVYCLFIKYTFYTNQMWSVHQ